MRSLKIYCFCLIATTWVALNSCGNNNDKTPASLSDTTPDSVTFKERIDWPKNQAEQDNTEVDKNVKDYVGSYTYRVNPYDVPVAVVEREEPNTTPKEVTPKQVTNPPKKLEKINIDVQVEEEEIPEITLNETASLTELRMNRPPLFGSTCLQTELPVKCSRDNLRTYIQNNLKYPRMAKFNDHDGMEHVTFTITKEGEVTNIKVRGKDRPCSGCADAAAAVVSSMPDKWVPALRNGKPVSVTVTLPIELETDQVGDKLFE